MLAVVLCPLMVVGCGPQQEGESAPTTEQTAGADGQVKQLKWMCGDGYCNGDEPTTCPEDCTGGWCGDGYCGSGESYNSCSVDCPYTPPPSYCGNGYCDGGEDSWSCPGDCGGGSCRTPSRTTGTSKIIPCE
jgi:hypothetical protein